MVALCFPEMSSLQRVAGEAWANLAFLEAEGERGTDGVVLLVRT